MVPELKTLPKDIIKTDHFHKATTLHPRIFKTECKDMGSWHKSSLHHIGVRWYLNGKGKGTL
jgi:hypothetical protein